MKKKDLAIFSVLIVILCLSSSCGKSEYAREREAEEAALYESGYDAGYAEGYRAAMNSAPEDVESCVDDDIWDLDRDIKNAYGFYSEDAINTLTNYADGEPVTKSDLIEAIWAIRQYYWGVYEIVNDIGDYWID